MKHLRLFARMPAFAAVALALLTAVLPAYASQATPEAEAAALPLVVLTEFDPWRPVLGSDSPSFALYDDGLVIYTRLNDSDDAKHVSVQLTEAELDALLETLDIGENFYALDSYYDLVLKTDQPSNVMYVWNDEGELKTVGVYGDLRRDDEARAAAPQTYLRVFDAVTSFDHEDAEFWLPEQFEVMLWDYDTSDAEPWPAEYPGLDDPTTVRQGGVYSVYLPVAELDRFDALAQDANAFELDGKTYAFAVRFPFPQEALWLEAE